MWALYRPVLAVVLGLLLGDDLVGYPLRFGLTWFAFGVLVGAVRFASALRRGG